MKRITVVGELVRNTGYGQHALEVINHLQDKGYFVSVRVIGGAGNLFDCVRPFLVHTPQPEPIEVLIAPPHHVPTPGKKVVNFSMWESSVLLPHSVDFMNMSSTVVVPCQWNAQLFKTSGVDRPIRVVPLGIDSGIFDYRPMRPGLCVFGAAGNMGNGSKRKGLADVIRIFQAAFPTEEDVRLRIKAIGDLALPSDDRRIEFTNRPMTDDQLAEWYAGLTCFASMAKSEAWGLMQQQAMGCGRPVIAAIYGGLSEFMDQSVGYPVDYTEVPAEEIWTGHGNWCQPDEGDFSHQMRQVYKHREVAEELGWKASQRASEFPWKRSCAMLADIVESER